MSDKMEWKKLLDPARLKYPNGNIALGPDKKENVADDQKSQEDDIRYVFRADARRICYSRAFRRLQAKTQVQPFPQTEYTRTRLTHSIEVATIAKQISLRLVNFIKRQCKEADNDIDAIVDICYASAFAHDVGNPPFGHVAEDAIRSWIARNGLPKSQHERSSGKLKAQLDINAARWSDFTRYDGNAQGFRVLTQLEGWPGFGGLRLSYPVLAAFTKYPFGSDRAVEGYRFFKNIGNEIPDERFVSKCTKYNFMHSEENIAIKIFTDLGLKRINSSIFNKNDSYEFAFCRHPLSYIVEAADDIAYMTTDIEDAVESGVLRYEEAAKVIDGCLNFLEKKNKLTNFETLELDPFFSITDKISYLRSVSIHGLVLAAVDSFMKNYESLMNGTMRGDLLDHSEIRDTRNELKDLVVKRVHTSRDKVELEAMGAHVLYRLLDFFAPAIIDYLACGEDYRNINDKRNQKAFQILFSEQIHRQNIIRDNIFDLKRNAITNEQQKIIKIRAEMMDTPIFDNPYNGFQMMLDYITALTDRQAVDLYSKLLGTKLNPL